MHDDEMKEYTGSSPVLFIVNGLGIGGSERKTVTIVNELFRANWNVHLAYLADRTAGLNRLESGVPLAFLGKRAKVSLGAINKLRTRIQANKIGKVVCVNLYPLLYASIASQLLRKSERPSIYLLVNTTKLLGTKEKLQMFLYRLLIRRVKAVVFGCDAQRRLWRSQYGLATQCLVIYNGVDTNRFMRRTSDGGKRGQFHEDVHESDFVVGTIGQLRAVKNHTELIAVAGQLAEKLPNFRLVIAGHGPERASLDRAARNSAGRSRIVFLGQVTDVYRFLERMDVFVLPSISETFSNAVLEAMAMELPVVITDTGGAREMVENGSDGFIYAQGDLDGLADQITQLGSDPELRRVIGHRARETVLRRFTFEGMIGEYQKLLE